MIRSQTVSLSCLWVLPPWCHRLSWKPCSSGRFARLLHQTRLFFFCMNNVRWSLTENSVIDCFWRLCTHFHVYKKVFECFPAVLCQYLWLPNRLSAIVHKWAIYSYSKGNLFCANKCLKAKYIKLKGKNCSIDQMFDQFHNTAGQMSSTFDTRTHTVPPSRWPCVPPGVVYPLKCFYTLAEALNDWLNESVTDGGPDLHCPVFVLSPTFWSTQAL